MVTLNLTLLIQVGLFLLFMWGTDRLILRPMLRLVDQRDEQVEGDRAQAQESAEKARELEERYAREISSARRKATFEIERARNEALEERMRQVAERRRVIEEHVEQARRDAQAEAESQRDQFDSLAESLAGAMRERVGVKPGGTA
jgi:F-type H+-transporting ATPase subunit b